MRSLYWFILGWSLGIVATLWMIFGLSWQNEEHIASQVLVSLGIICALYVAGCLCIWHGLKTLWEEP